MLWLIIGHNSYGGVCGHDEEQKPCGHFITAEWKSVIIWNLHIFGEFENWINSNSIVFSLYPSEIQRTPWNQATCKLYI